MSRVRSHIGVKRMGELDQKAFVAACKEKIADDVKLALLCSKWEDEIRQPEWHPFKVINVDGEAKVLLFLTSLFHFYVVYAVARKWPFCNLPLNTIVPQYTTGVTCEAGTWAQDLHVSITFSGILYCELSYSMVDCGLIL